MEKFILKYFGVNLNTEALLKGHCQMNKNSLLAIVAKQVGIGCEWEFLDGLL